MNGTNQKTTDLYYYSLTRCSEMLLKESIALENGDGSSFSCQSWAEKGVIRDTETHQRFADPSSSKARVSGS